MRPVKTVVLEGPASRPTIAFLEVPTARRLCQIRRFLEDGQVEIRTGAEDSWIRVSSVAIRENQCLESAVFEDENTERVQMEVTHRETGKFFQGRLQVLKLISGLSQPM